MKIGNAGTLPILNIAIKDCIQNKSVAEETLFIKNGNNRQKGKNIATFTFSIFIGLNRVLKYMSASTPNNFKITRSETLQKSRIEPNFQKSINLLHKLAKNLAPDLKFLNIFLTTNFEYS